MPGSSVIPTTTELHAWRAAGDSVSARWRPFLSDPKSRLRRDSSTRRRGTASRAGSIRRTSRSQNTGALSAPESVVRSELPLPTADRLLGGTNRLGEHWAWYAARRPSLLRGIQHAFERKIHDVTFPIGEPIWLDDPAEVPLPEDDAGPAWQQIEQKDYRADSLVDV